MGNRPLAGGVVPSEARIVIAGLSAWRISIIDLNATFETTSGGPDVEAEVAAERDIGSQARIEAQSLRQRGPGGGGQAGVRFGVGEPMNGEFIQVEGEHSGVVPRHVHSLLLRLFGERVRRCAEREHTGQSHLTAAIGVADVRRRHGARCLTAPRDAAGPIAGRIAGVELCLSEH